MKNIRQKKRKTIAHYYLDRIYNNIEEYNSTQLKQINAAYVECNQLSAIALKFLLRFYFFFSSASIAYDISHFSFYSFRSSALVLDSFKTLPTLV